MAYWDTGCLLKLYVPEPNSDYFKALILSNPLVVTSEISRLEIFAALCRKEAANEIPAEGAKLASAEWDANISLQLIQISPLNAAVKKRYEAVIEQRYRRSPALQLRTLDADHLATAVVCEESEMVTTDKRLREAAILLGLTLFPV